MTSKELLESIKHTIEGVFYPREIYKKTSDEFKQLEKHLQIFDILKQHFVFNLNQYKLGDENTYILQINGKEEHDDGWNYNAQDKITEIEYQQLKEWLNK